MLCRHFLFSSVSFTYTAVSQCPSPVTVPFQRHVSSVEPVVPFHLSPVTVPPIPTPTCTVTLPPTTDSVVSDSSTVFPTHPMFTRSKSGIFKPKVFHSTKHRLPQIFLANLSSKPIPSITTQALKDPNWRKAMTDEYNALLQTHTWSLVPPHPSQNVIGSKWVFKVKEKPDGSIERFKARLVAKGFHQQPGLDYHDTFSPVAKATTIRLVLSLAVQFNWPINKIDVSNAFLYGTLSEAVFMAQPAGFVDPTKPHHVCHLHK